MNNERTEWLAREPREELSKKLGIAAWILTAAVLGLVGLMRQVKIPLPEGVSLSFLPPFHAAVNAVAAVVLVIAFVAVIRGRISLHRRMIMVAMGLSVLFLLSYVAYHFTSIAGRTNRFAAHRRLARWVFPMWLYVAVTGPVCYWMLRPYY